jgi:N-methylhydantoinase B
LRSTKHTVAPKGIDGGLNGKTGHCILNPNTDKARVIPSRYSDHTLSPGDVVCLETPGGGGLGNPVERDPLMVLNDVRNGYVTPQKARELYRVAVEQNNGDYAVNEPQTRELRSQA